MTDPTRPLLASVLSPLSLGVAKPWKVGLCGCGSTSASAKLAWMMALLCPCVPLAQVASRFSGRTAYVVVLCLGMLLHMSFVVLVYIAWCHNPSHWPSFVEQLTSLFMMQLNDLPIYCWGVWAVLVAYLRSYGRAKMQLAGNFGSDLVVACCCTSCAIAQLATQVDVYAANVRRDDCRQYYFGPRDVLPPYLALEPRKPLKYSSARTVVV